MDAAMASIQLSLSQVQLSASYAVAGKAMETAEAQADQLIEMMLQTPSFGHRLDVRV